MKKLLTLALTSILVVSLTACQSNDKGQVSENTFKCDTLNVYNWGEYIGETVIQDFEDKFNVKVNYSLFDSNEALYTQLLGGSAYDILVPSEYMIERLRDEDLLQPLDLNLVPNISNLSNGLKGLAYDPNNEYSVPYFWGNVGIVYNTKTIDSKKVEELGYSIFLDESIKDKAFIYDSERDSFMMAFKALGYSMNTTSEKEIQEAYEWLLKMDETINPYYVTDEVIDGMITEQKDIAVAYSGQASVILDENPDMEFFLPNEGTNYWTDGLVIPKDSQCSDLAHAFINEMLSYDVAYQNSEYVGYPSNNQQVLDELSSEGGYYEGNSAYLPETDVDNSNHEYFIHNETLIKQLSELWINVKSK